MLKEFKAFALRGNVMDMAIGVIIGGAFGKIVSSVVQDVIMPPIGLLMGNVDFSNLFITLNGQKYDSLKLAQEAGAPTLRYGLFLNNVVDFVIVAFVIFMMVKQINRFTEKAAPAPAPSNRECPHCLSMIPLKASRCAHCTSQLK